MKNILKIFWNKVEKTDSCWVRRGGQTGHGYNVLRWSGKQRYAHRISWELHYGSIPKGLCVLHKCDNPPCVNPEHLFLGTLADNIHDMIRKGRRGYTGLQGEKHPDSKLTTQQVSEIRNLYKKGVITQTKLGQLYGVGQANIARILNKTSWKHI